MNIHWGQDMIMTEVGVEYFTDYPDRVHHGWMRMDYKWYSPGNKHSGISHVYVYANRLVKAMKSLERLCFHWSRIGWTYKPVTC